jgi:membrane protease YdiL (CAAX protease family)
VGFYPVSACDPAAVVTPPGRPARRRVLAVLLFTWFAANALTHATVATATGRIYYQLSLFGLLGAEASISLLNFLLPVLALRYVLRQTGSFSASFGWKWTGWRIPLPAMCGFIAFMLLSMASNWAFAGATIQYGSPGMAGPESRVDYLVFTLMLLVCPAMGEETMFRGFLQPRLTAMYGATAGVLISAALFAIRHHPSDIYFGIVNGVPAAGWANRAVQLYVGAVIFGLVRHFARSTWASWILHMMIIVLILILGGFFRGLFVN